MIRSSLIDFPGPLPRRLPAVSDENRTRPGVLAPRGHAPIGGLAARSVVCFGSPRGRL